jgi:ABC-type branched-subunit amino acid transport system ATPase component
LAVTVGTEPELLLLDEPTCGMSPEEAESMSLIKLSSEKD